MTVYGVVALRETATPARKDRPCEKLSSSLR